ncbi:MAG TPA: cell division protein ZapA [Gammaproteobacteria bacterium]|nr:cell division protein ZapA [Gammaproteobacteria bacterium]
MTDAQTRVNVRILDRDYQIACPPDEKDALLESAALLNRKMQEIRKSGAVIGLDRIAVMAALNLAHEFLQTDASRKHITDDVAKRLQRMHDKVELTLVEERAAS